MRPNPGEEDRIEAEAAEWWVERDAGMSAVRRREFRAWCRQDPRHAAAFGLLEQTRSVFQDLPLIRSELQPVIRFPGTSTCPGQEKARGNWQLRVAIGCAALLALAAIAWWQWRRGPVDALEYETTSGGYERVVLSDGSIMELNSGTRAVVEFVKAERRVSLRTGEAHFTVAHDKARPFVVAAGPVAVRAVGTAFDVRVAPASIEVLVTEGTVRLATPAPAANVPAAAAGLDSAAGPTLLNANERLVIPSPSQPGGTPGVMPPVVEKVSPEMIRTALAWQERKLVFAATPLQDVVAQFNRRNHLQLIVADASLATLPVGGTFAANNPEGFVRLFEESKIISVEHRGESELVLHDAR